MSAITDALSKQWHITFISWRCASVEIT